jgi:hypothetical protein
MEKKIGSRSFMHKNAAKQLLLLFRKLDDAL